MYDETFNKGQILYVRNADAGWGDNPGAFFKVLDVADDLATLVQLKPVVKSEPGGWSRYRGIWDYKMYPLENDEIGVPFKTEVDYSDDRVPLKGNFPFNPSVIFVWNGKPIEWTEDSSD